MAKFRKKIVTPGVKTVGRLDGRNEKDAITPSRIKNWVENTKKLKELGVLIPAPLAHQDKEHKLAFPVIVGKDGETLADAYSGANDEIPPAWDLANLNAGFWDTFDQDADGSLVGEVDVPNEDKAKKIGTEVKQTSVLVMPGRRIVDKEGNEHEVGEHLAHVAICLHAQEPGQENFVPLSPVPDSLAMSFVIAMDDITGLPDPSKPKDEKLYRVITLLRSSLGVALPEDTTRENFLDSLTLVLTQKLADQQEQQTQEPLTMRPNDANTQTPSIAMSQTVTPNKSEAILMSMLNKSKKKELKDRIDKLVGTGRTSKDYADKVLYPRCEAFAMSASDLTDKGDFNKSSLEELIEGLEAATPLVGPSLVDEGTFINDLPAEASVEVPPQDVIVGTAINDLSAAQADEILDSCGL